MSSGTAVKRLAKELRDIQSEQEKLRARGEALPFEVFPLEDSFLHWHFTVQGPEESPFEHGRYHGTIEFPITYPFAPPHVTFLTPSGRFDVGTRICLSFTGFHPETWQPAWGVHSMLMALRQHFTSEDAGAIGSLQYPPSERLALAQRSQHSSCSQCGYNRPQSSDHGGVMASTPSAPVYGYLLWTALGLVVAMIVLYYL